MARLYRLFHRVVSQFFRLFGYRLLRNDRVLSCEMPLFDLGIKLLEASGRDVFLVQVGASDGVTSDPFYPHCGRLWIKGLLVEPLEEPFRKLLRNYKPYSERFTCLNLAVADYCGNLRLWIPESSNSVLASQKASCRRNHLVAHKMTKVSHIDVECRTISKLLLDANVARVDILIVDAEGADWRILNNAFQDGLEPLLIYLEVLHLTRSARHEFRAALQGRGYYYCESLKDCFAIKKELLS